MLWWNSPPRSKYLFRELIKKRPKKLLRDGIVSIFSRRDGETERLSIRNIFKTFCGITPTVVGERWPGPPYRRSWEYFCGLMSIRSWDSGLGNKENNEYERRNISRKRQYRRWRMWSRKTKNFLKKHSKPTDLYTLTLDGDNVTYCEFKYCDINGIKPFRCWTIRFCRPKCGTPSVVNTFFLFLFSESSDPASKRYMSLSAR